jgi:ABC-type bacteriocin/lantibiotic exporter with double-glycine peptidase domain
MASVTCFVTVSLVLGVSGLAAAPPGASPTEPHLRAQHDGGNVVTIMSPPCGPTAMAVVFRLLDRPVSNAALGAIAGASGESSFAQLRDFAVAHGLHAEAVRGSLHDLLALDAPAILHLALPPSAEEGFGEAGHFVVLAGKHAIDSVLVLDPTGVTPFNGVTPIEPLLESWTGAALVISDAPIAGMRESSVGEWSVLAANWVLPLAVCLLGPYVALTLATRKR